MKTYRVMQSGDAYTKYNITEEGAKLIWAAYEKLYGRYQTMERREERGGICYTGEIELWIKEGALPKDFDWTIYKVIN